MNACVLWDMCKATCMSLGASNTLRSLKHEDACPHSPQVTGSSLVMVLLTAGGLARESGGDADR